MTSQLVKFLRIISAFIFIWMVLPWDNDLIAYAPVVAIVMLVIYAVLSVIYGVATFNDCEDAKISLQFEIKEAREFLLKKNLIKSD